jgi:hypothetical protein
MGSESQLSRGGAVAMGVACIACGVMPILIGLGVVHASGEPSPAWVAIAAGLMFVCGGLAVILDYAIAGGVGPDGDLPPGTPFVIRVGNYALGLAIVGGLTSICGWVAFGSGPRAFSSTLSLPFLLPQRWQSSELSGRAVFGLATVLMAMMFVGCGIYGARRLVRQARGERSGIV